MRHQLMGLGALAALLALPPLAWAEDEPADRAAGRGSFFDRIDKNGDGFITADEIAPERATFFERMLREGDKDGDGKLSREEFRVGFAERARGGRVRPEGGNFGGRLGGIVERLKQLDTNQDGKVSLDEVPEERRDMFEALLDQFDEDGDDAISLEEMTKAARVLSERFGAERGGPAGRPSPEPAADPQPERRRRLEGRPVPGVPPLGAGPLLRVLDLDGDGALSAEEIAAAPESLKALDRNNDGRITRRELISAMGATLAVAGDEPRQRPDPAAMIDRLMQADKDGDGKLSIDELPPRLKERAARLDANGDGFVERAELEAAFQGRAERGGEKAKKPEAKTKKKNKKPGKSDASET